jgi:hypothetical protein
MPHFNPRRAEVEGQRVPDREWVMNAGGPSGGNGIGAKKGEGKGLESAWFGSGAVGWQAVTAAAHSKAFWIQEGQYVDFERTARRGGYCGVRQLTVLKEGAWGVGNGGNWDTIAGMVPPLKV